MAHAMSKVRGVKTKLQAQDSLALPEDSGASVSPRSPANGAKFDGNP